MSLAGDKSFKMKIRDVENAFKYRRIPYPKRSVELIAILAISCTFFLFMHTNKLNSRLKEMEVKLQPSEFSALGLTGNQISGRDANKHDNINTLHGTYQYLKSTGQRRRRSAQSKTPNKDDGHKNERHHYRRHPRQPHQPLTKNADADNILADPKTADLDDNYDDGEDHHGAGHLRKGGSGNKKYDNNSSNTDTDTDYTTDYGLNADELNNTKKAEVDVVFFNRVPKVGSQALMQLMIRLSKVNDFEHSRDGGKRYETVIMVPEKQREVISNILTKPQPQAFSQHVAYINFTRFHMPKPIYINMVRDPIERVISWHYYVRAEWYYKDMDLKLGKEAPPHPPKEFMDMDLDTCVRIKDPHCQFLHMQTNERTGDHRRQTLFFCGHNRKVCMPFNSVVAMQKAKRTVEEDYAVVGTWEDTNVTLTVLEHYVPKFFKGAKIVYYLGKDQLSKVNKNPVKRPVSQESRELIRQNLTHEIEFYEFCKQRLYMQYAAVTKGEQIDNDDYLLIPLQDEEEADKADEY